MYCTVLSAIKAYNGYQTCHKALWINPAANITFSVITPETAGFEPLTPGTGGKSTNHSAVRLGKSLGQYPTWYLSLTAKWLETSPPNTGVEGSNPRGLKCDNRKGYIGSWIHPVLCGMDDTRCRLWLRTVLYYPQGTSWRVWPRTWGGLPWWRRFQALRYQGCYRLYWRLDLSRVLCGMADSWQYVFNTL